MKAMAKQKMNIDTSAYEIATRITTPVSLAALAVLVMSATFAIIIRQGGNKGRIKLYTQLARYSFTLGLVLGLAAIASYVYTDYAQSSSEYRVSGSVLDDTNNEPIYLADVSISGGPSTEAKEDGSFEFTLPRSRFPNGYTLVAHDSHYSPATIVTTHNFSAPLTIKLKRTAADSNVFEKISKLYVCHWVGLPYLVVEFGLMNKNKWSLRLQELSGTLVSPEREEFAFDNLLITGLQPPPTGPVYRIRASERAIIAGEFFRANDKFLQLGQRVNQEIASNPPNQNFALAVDRLSPPLVQALQEQAKQHFYWHEGAWQLVLTTAFDGVAAAGKYRFSLSKADMDRLQSNIGDYRYGYGVLAQAKFAGTGGGCVLVETQS
jgi:hypothetical protein